MSMEFSYESVYISKVEKPAALHAIACTEPAERRAAKHPELAKQPAERPMFDTSLRRLIESTGWTWRPLPYKSS